MIYHAIKGFTSLYTKRTCSSNNMLHIKCIPVTQMAAAALQFCLVSSPHLACISSHILPDVKTGTFLGHCAWLGPNKWAQKAIALT